MGTYQISVIETKSQWDAIRSTWNPLLDNCAFPNIFLTWEWLNSWIECFLGNAKDLFIITVYDGAELVAAAPWCVHRLGNKIFGLNQIEFLCTPETGSDYLDVVIKKGKEKEVVQYIYEFLLKDAFRRWGRIWLHDIPSNSLFMLHLLEKIQNNGKYVGLKEASFCPVLVVPRSEDELFAGLSASWRKKFKQDLRNMKKGLIEHQTFKIGTDLDALDTFFRLYEEKTEWSGEKLHLHLANFINKLNGTDSIQIDLLLAQDRYVGGLLHLKFKDTLYMYLMAIDKEFNSKISLGNSIVGLSIINAIHSGIAYYDFLKGTENYKFHWANFGRRSCSILFSQRKPIPIYHTLKDFAKSGAKLILR